MKEVCRMKNSCQLATLVVLLSFCQTGLAYERQAQPISQSPLLAFPTKAENELLQGELKAIREYHGSLLDTVYWSLGIVFGLVVLIIGSSFYTNFRLYEADKARILEEVERKIAEANSRASRDLQLLSSSLSEKIDRDILALANRFSTEIERLRSDNKDADKQILSDLKELEEAFEVFLKFPGIIKDQLNKLNLDTQLNTETIWELKGDPTKKLFAQFLAFDGALRTGSNDSIKAVLERMKDNLISSVLPSGKKVPSSVVESMKQALVHVRENRPLGESELILDLALVAEILELIDKIKT